MSNVYCNKLRLGRGGGHISITFFFFFFPRLLICLLTLYRAQIISPEGEVTTTIAHSCCNKVVTSTMLEHLSSTVTFSISVNTDLQTFIYMLNCLYRNTQTVVYRSIHMLRVKNMLKNFRDWGLPFPSGELCSYTGFPPCVLA